VHHDRAGPALRYLARRSQAGILREAGLITTRRAGQAVRHDLTALGRMVLDGAGGPTG
jgi:predicted MarR family transcription regulator